MRDNENRKKRLSANAKWGIALVAELIIIVAMIVVYANNWLNEKYSLLNVNDYKEEELDINEDANIDMKGYTTIALFGIDARDSSLESGNRSDSMIVVSINNDTKEVKMVSVYRDTLLEIQKDSPSTAKCNGAYAYGGPLMAIQTLNANLDLNITEYVTVNFEGLTRAIDMLGGVYVNVEANELDTLNRSLAEQISINGIYSEGVFETGYLKLNGAQATAYARIRSTGQGDITRTERQREVLTSMVEQMKKCDLSTINAMIDELFPYISTSITKDEMIQLASSLISYELSDESLGFPISYSFYDGGSKGSCIAANNLEENVKALHRFMFETEEYQPSANVKRISNLLINETGVNGGTVLLPGEEEVTEPDTTAAQ